MYVTELLCHTRHLSTNTFSRFYISVLHLFVCSLGHSLSLDHGWWNPAEFYRALIIQRGFFNSHVLPNVDSNCETLPERTDHLSEYHQPRFSLVVSVFFFHFKSNRWSCRSAHGQLRHFAFIHVHTSQ